LQSVANISQLHNEKKQYEGDFCNIIDEKTILKQQMNEWKDKCYNLDRELNAMKHDNAKLESLLKIEQKEKETLREELNDKEIKIKTLKDETKEMKTVQSKIKDMKYEIGMRDENIQRLKVENQQLKSDLKIEVDEKNKNIEKLKNSSKQLDKQKTQNAKLQSEIEDLQQRLSGAVSKQLHEETQRELSECKKLFETMRTERDHAIAEVADLKAKETQLKQENNLLSIQYKSCIEQFNDLQAAFAFYKQNTKSLRQELQRIQSSNCIHNVHNNNMNHHSQSITPISNGNNDKLINSNNLIEENEQLKKPNYGIN